MKWIKLNSGNKSCTENKKAPQRKMSYLFAIIALLGAGTIKLVPDDYFKPALENEIIQNIKSKLAIFNKHLPEERLYINCDKPLYAPGDDIWLAGFLTDAQSLKPSHQSDIVHVELIGPKGNVEQKINLIAKNGKFKGDFSLNKETRGGLYKLKAYTNWIKNKANEDNSENNFFEKEIQVQEIILPHLKMKLDFEKKAFGAADEVIAKLELQTNENKPLQNHKINFTASLNGIKLIEKAEQTDEDGTSYIKFKLPEKLENTDGLLNVIINYNGNPESISRSIPIVLNKIAFNLYPEGGDLVVGLENTIAFAAKNEFDKPADVEGEVITLKGSKVATFSSFHQGMGAFKFTPQSGENYIVKITKPAGINESFKIPEPFERGYLLHLDNSLNGEVKVGVQSTEAEELSLVAQIRGKIYYTTIINALPGETKFNFQTNNMPAGVCQVTLFDAKGIARAERLVFVNRDKQMNIKIETDKEKYLPREKVKMTISVKDERGMPTPAHLNLAVVNDQLLSFADDKSGNIISQLLLQQDINCKIEEPAFYFDKKEIKSAKALDYLLMTAGWRRFTWEKLLKNDLPPVLFPAQKAIITGRVIDANTGNLKAGVKILSATGHEFTSDSSGNFSISGIDLSSPATFTFMANGFTKQVYTFNDYGQNTMVYLYNVNVYPEEIQASSHSAKLKVVQKNRMMAGHKQQALEAVAVKENLRIPMAAAPAIELNDNEFAAQNHNNMDVLVNDFDKSDDARLPLNEKPANGNFFLPHNENEFKKKRQIEAPAYYRARVFAGPVYEKQQIVETRSDFRNTIYWNPDIEIGYSGRKTIEFYTSDDITSFKATLQGITADGMPGFIEKNIYTQLPFELSTKIPVEVANEDVLSIPVTLKNNTNEPLGGNLIINTGEGLEKITEPQHEITIMPGQAKTLFVDYRVLNKPGTTQFSVNFKSCGLSDAISRDIKMVPRGFPVQASFSGQDEEKEFSFEIYNMVKGSLRATFNAYPNVVNDLVKGVDGILQEPYGCFEQTSCTAYPNAMVLDYLKHNNSEDTKTLARATSLLDRGYKRLTTFEAPNKGYEWFGANPGHEGLTAYGLMEFMDMKRAGQEIDEQMFDRTARWLLNHRDGKGGFAREGHAYHDFGRISNDILNAYIVYALADAGFSDIKKEFETSYKKALDTKDPYLLAMITNAAFSLKYDNMAMESLKQLLGAQQNNGSFNGTTHSITYSQGQSLSIETTALSIMAILKSENKNVVALHKAVNYLVSTRSGSGVFGSTQGTILALKSLTEYAKFSKKTSEDGTIVIYLDGKKIAEKKYIAGEKDAISVDGLENFIKGEGKHKLKIKYVDVKNPLPYSLAVNWNTFLPQSNKDCNLDLLINSVSKTVNVGETMRFGIKIINRKNTDVPSAIALIGIPAGFSAQPWQLKEIQDKKICDYYELKGNYIAFYYRGLGPNAVQQINLDLKAELPGEYETPASSAYLYYTNEYKTWCGSGKVVIKKTNI